MRMYGPTILAGLLLASFTNANAQWEIQNSHTSASLRGIHNLGGGVVWASGASGTVLETKDGGLLWQNCVTPPGAEKLDFRGIQGFDESTAIVMSSGKGHLSRVYKTTDGCRSWKLVLTNPDEDGFWDAIRFTAPENGQGVLLGDPVNGKFVVYVTADKGETWKPAIGAAAEAMRDESIFAASNSAAIAPGVDGSFAFVTGGPGGARLLWTEPHGPFDMGPANAFSAIRLPFVSSESAGAFSVASRRRGELGMDLMVVGGDYRAPNAAGAAAYVPFRGRLPRIAVNSAHPPQGYRSAVAYDSEHKLWITVGPNGTDISTDDGKTWRALKPRKSEAAEADRNWNALSLPFAVGPDGRIGRLDSRSIEDAISFTSPARN
jgi:photosystem II stability/assembly factor-like uncharacterized protein